MSKLYAVITRLCKKLFPVLFIVFVVTLQSCYHYRIINTNNDPGTEYKDTVMVSYVWGLVNKPQFVQVPNCPDNTALDEVVYSKNFGQSVLTLITLGIVSPVKVKWKCHKPCQVITPVYNNFKRKKILNVTTSNTAYQFNRMDQPPRYLYTAHR